MKALPSSHVIVKLVRGPGIAQPLTPRHRGPDGRLLTGLGGVVVRLHTTIAPAFLFTLVCREARKKISSCEALHFQKLCCLMPLSVELDVSLLLPSLVHKQKRACRAPAVWSGEKVAGTSLYADSKSRGGNETQHRHALIATWRSRLVSWLDTEPLSLERSAFAASSRSPVGHCGASCLTPWEIPSPVPPRMLYRRICAVYTAPATATHTLTCAGFNLPAKQLYAGRIYFLSKRRIFCWFSSSLLSTVA